MSEENMEKHIAIAIKVRPLSKKEKDLKLQEKWEINRNTIRTKDMQNNFNFENLFGPETRNRDVYDAIVRPIVELSLEGFNGTIFAYGQTSSGKTYTMSGNVDDPGIMIMAIRHLFQGNDSLPERTFLIRVGYIEIYNEKIHDLLNDRKEIRFSYHSDDELTNKEIIVTNEEAVMKILLEGNKVRKAASTKMNQFSSRSHAVFRIIIESEDVNGTVRISHLNLVDLAGSERAEDVVTSEYQKNELKYINRSLLELSLAIKSLSNGEQLGNDLSKLNKILRDSLGGNSNTAIICNVAILAVDQTALTLNFAKQARNVRNLAVCNKDSENVSLMKKVQREVAILKLRLDTKVKCDKLDAQVKKKESLFLMSKEMRPRAEKSTTLPLHNVSPSISKSTSMSFPTFERINTQLVLKLSPCLTMFQSWHHSKYLIGEIEDISQQRVMRITNAIKYSDYYLERVGFELNTILRKNLKMGKNIIGRSDEINDVDIYVESHLCSRKHCVITVSDNAVFIQDLNTSNGTAINGINKKRDTVELHERDVIGIGNDIISENDLVGNFQLAVYRLCKHTSENLPTFAIEDDENSSQDVNTHQVKVKSEKRKAVPVKSKTRLEKRCKIVKAPAFPTTNESVAKQLDIEPALENIDLIQLMKDLTSIEGTGTLNGINQSSPMPVVENVDELLDQLFDTKGTEFADSSAAAALTEMSVDFTKANQTIDEMENEIQKLKQTIQTNEEKEAKSIEDNKKHIEDLQSKLSLLIEEKNVLKKQHSEMLTKINDATYLKGKYDRSQKENAKLKTQLKELKEKNELISKTVYDENQKLLQSVQKLEADNLKLVQELSVKKLALALASNAPLTGMDADFSTATQTVLRIQNEVSNIKSTPSTYEQTIKIWKLKDALNKTNEQLVEMETALKKRIQRFDDQFPQKCDNFKGTSGDNNEKVENRNTAGQTEWNAVADARKQPITIVNQNDPQLGELIGNIVHVDVLPDGSHRVVLRHLDGTFAIFDITNEQYQLLHK